jgi:hypothetical protein
MGSKNVTLLRLVSLRHQSDVMSDTDWLTVTLHLLYSCIS